MFHQSLQLFGLDTYPTVVYRALTATCMVTWRVYSSSKVWGKKSATSINHQK